MKTLMANKESVEHKWYYIDAKDKTLGRLASLIAMRLRGKHKPYFTPHTDCGDYIIVVNSEKIAVSGNKRAGKVYNWHTGYPGGIKSASFEEMQQRDPRRALELAVKGMLPRGPLGREVYRKLHVYAGAEHPHAAQQPEHIDL